MPRLVVQWQVEGDHVRFGVHLVERRRLESEIAEAIGRDERVVGDDTHTEPERPARDLATDTAETEHTQRLPGELDPGIALAIPDSRGQGCVRLRHVPREREQKRDRVLRRRDDGRLGGSRNDDPAPRRSVDVHVVDADPRTPYHLEPYRPLDHISVESRSRAHDDRVEFADDLGETRITILDDVEPAAQELEPGRGDRLAYENLRPTILSASRRRYGHDSPARTEQAEDAGSPDMQAYRGD